MADFTLNSLESATPASGDYFLKSNANAEYRKCTLEQLAGAINNIVLPVGEYDLSANVKSNFNVTRARFKKIGPFHWFSIQVTVINAFDAPYGEQVLSVGQDIAPYPSYTAELIGYNVTKKTSVRAYRSSANVSVVGSFSAGDVIVIGGMYLV